VSDLVEVGRYTRDLGASIDRLYENALDWEHLPHLHKSDFASIAVIAHSHAGWQAEGGALRLRRPASGSLPDFVAPDRRALAS
jgi:hypothetical protein